MSLPALTLTGAEFLWPDGPGPGPLSLRDGLITDDPAPRRVDLSGFLVLPGMVDAHGDGFEHHLAPRHPEELSKAYTTLYLCFSLT